MNRSRRALAAIPAPVLSPGDEEVGMSRTTRRLAQTALLLGLALFLAVAPAQARESPAAGWFSAFTHQLVQWTAGLWGLAGPAANRSLSPTRPPAPGAG